MEGRRRDTRGSDKVLQEFLAAVGQDRERGDFQHLLVPGRHVREVRAVVIDKVGIYAVNGDGV